MRATGVGHPSHLLAAPSAAERGGRPQVRERVFITATHNPAGIGDDADVAPVAYPTGGIDGFDPKQEWHLRTSSTTATTSRVAT